MNTRDRGGPWDVGKWAMVIVAVIVIITMIGIIILYATGVFKRRASNDDVTPWPNDRSKKLRETVNFNRYAALSCRDIKPGSIIDLMATCERYKKKLPVPTNDKEYAQLLDAVKEYHKVAGCSNYALGLKLNPYLRYKSIDGLNSWASTQAGGSVGDVSGADRDCVVLRIRNDVNGQNVTLKEHVKCDAINKFDCVMFQKHSFPGCGFGVGSCYLAMKIEKDKSKLSKYSLPKLEHPFINPFSTDVEIDRESRIDVEPIEESEVFDMGELVYESMEYYLEQMNIKFPNTRFGLMVVDKNHLPKRLTNVPFKGTRECYAREVEYVLEYVNVYSGKIAESALKINSKTKPGEDPEWECLRFTPADNFALHKGSCHNVGCPICF